jgi:hypothetical protein
MQKARDATGLGFMAHALSRGDHSVFENSPQDRHIRIVANAIHRPGDFWKWLEEPVTAAAARRLIENARRFRNAGRPRDRAVVQAAAYLAASGTLPEIRPAAQTSSAFPYWIALDAHTPQGRRVLNDVARDLHISLKQLEWAFFYFEGALTNGAVPSYWWDRSCRWHFRKFGLAADEAHLLWEPAKPQVLEALAEDSRQLHRELYEWKMAHRDRIDTLKKKVALFSTHRDARGVDQRKLF